MESVSLVGAVGIEPSSPLVTRKLLIPCFDKSDKNDRNAQARYVAGTREELIPYGIKSMRDQMEQAFPWLNDLPMMTPSRMEAALKKGSGIDYNRMMHAALGTPAEATMRKQPIPAGYSAKTARAQASHLLTKVNIAGPAEIHFSK